MCARRPSSEPSARCPGSKGRPSFRHGCIRSRSTLCRDSIRRQRRAPTVQLAEGVDPAELAAEHGPVESIEDLVSRRELSAVVEEAMALLPEEQRTAIVLKEYRGMTFRRLPTSRLPPQHGEDAALSGA